LGHVLVLVAKYEDTARLVQDKFLRFKEAILDAG
jgi:hypothetical protein